MLAKFVDSFYSVLATFASFKSERTCHDTNCKSTKIFSDTCNNRGCTCTRSTTHTSSDKDHVCSSDSFRQSFFTFFCSFTSNFWTTSCTQTTSQFWTKLDNCFCFRTAKGLYISVGCDKFYTSNTLVNHAVDGVTTTTTNTNYLNNCALSCCCIK